MFVSVLVIEDNPHNLELMCYLLSAFGYRYSTALNGEAGMTALRNNRFDLIVCDVQLPKRDGYDIVREVKSDPILRQIPIIAVTAYAMVGDREKLLAAGFDGYIPKPIDPETFVPQLEHFIPAERRPSRPKPHPTSGSSKCEHENHYRILVVDNLPAQLELARGLLEHFGFAVTTANGITAALGALTRDRFDMILSDVNMNDGSGFDFIRMVKNDPALRDIPFVFITSTMDSDEERKHGLALGACRYIVRPIEPQLLVDELRSCLKAV